MYDVHALLNRFYDEEVRLGKDGRQKLADLRDLRLDGDTFDRGVGYRRGADTMAHGAFNGPCVGRSQTDTGPLHGLSFRRRPGSEIF